MTLLQVMQYFSNVQSEFRHKQKKQIFFTILSKVSWYNFLLELMKYALNIKNKKRDN